MPRLGDEIRLIRGSACQLTQGIEKRLCLSQIGRIEAFGEAIVEGLKQRKARQRACSNRAAAAQGSFSIIEALGNLERPSVSSADTVNGPSLLAGTDASTKESQRPSARCQLRNRPPIGQTGQEQTLQNRV